MTFGYEANLKKIAQDWLLFRHSIVENMFEHYTMKAIDLTKLYQRDLFGSEIPLADELPILIKFIESKKNHSVQVHSNDNQDHASGDRFVKSKKSL